MKKINYEDLGKKFKKEFLESYEYEKGYKCEKFLSDRTCDYVDDIRVSEVNAYYDEETQLYTCRIEVVAYNHRNVSVIYEKDIIDENDVLLDTEFYED